MPVHFDNLYLCPLSFSAIITVVLKTTHFYTDYTLKKLQYVKYNIQKPIIFFYQTSPIFNFNVY